MPTEDDVRRQIDLELFAEKEIASVAELAGEYDRDQDLVPMVLGGTGPVRVINVLELEVPEQWRERYYPHGMPQSPTVSPEARKRWTDIEPDSELVKQVPTEEREQWRDLEAAAIDRRLMGMDRNWMEMAQLCGLDGEPVVVRIFRDERLLPAIERWRPVIGDKHFRRLCDMWTARLSAREREVQHRQMVVERRPPPPKRTQMPLDWPPNYPNDLIPKTTVIIGEELKEHPVQTETLQLCTSVISRLTPHLCAAVEGKTLRADLALSNMSDLLDSLLVYNCDDPSERFRLKQELMKSDEWLRLAEEMARVSIAGKAEKRLDKKLLPDRATTGQRAVIDAFILKLLSKSGRKITRQNIWSVAGYTDRTGFEQFQRGDTKTTRSAAIAFNRVLNMTPEEFFRLLDKKLARK